jgi:DNA polymerase-1
MREVPVAEAAEYAAEDADITLQLRAKLLGPLKESGQTRVFYDIESKVLPVLVDMEMEGIRLDVEALEEFSRTLGRSIEELDRHIQEQAGVEFNLNSPKQLGEVLFEKLQLVGKPRKTRTGQYQTNEQILAGLAAAHPIVRDILAYREATKLKSTYVDTLPDAVFPATGRIHTTFSQVATATGRLASTNPNLQNIPIRTEQGQEIRKAFVPRDADHVLLSADYSQIELRIMAALSRDAAMLEAFHTGLDIHTATAAKVHHRMPDGVTPEMRRQAKMINYGLMYGMSTYGLASRLGVPRHEAEEIVQHYFETFPGIRQYIDDTIAFARTHGYVETVTGRRRVLRDINSRNATIRSAMERNAVNTPIQGTGADMIKLAMIAVHDAIAEAGLHARMLLQIHDELLFDVPREEVDQVLPLVQDCMIRALPMDVPIEVELGTGENWLEAH